jgi:hypothetical protein
MMEFLTRVTGLTEVCIGYLVFVLLLLVIFGLEEAYKRGEC